jgi:hypothetical protein
MTTDSEMFDFHLRILILDALQSAKGHVVTHQSKPAHSLLEFGRRAAQDGVDVFGQHDVHLLRVRTQNVAAVHRRAGNGIGRSVRSDRHRDLWKRAPPRNPNV